MFKTILLSIFFMGLFLGCSHKNAPDYSSKEYENINKDAILNAAKRVLKLSDTDFSIDSKRNSIDAIKIIPKNKGFTVDININKINFIAVQEDNQTKAKLKITHKEDFSDNKEKIITGSSHRLFWDRIEYILGLNNNWPTCVQYRLKVNFDGIFCDVLHNNNTTPTNKDIINNITIANIQNNITEETIDLIDINLSELENIVLPMNNEMTSNIPENDAIDDSIPIEVNDLNSSNIPNNVEPLIQENNETNQTLKLDIIGTEDNTTISTTEDINESIIPQMQKDTLPKDQNNTVDIEPLTKKKNIEDNSTIVSTDEDINKSVVSQIEMQSDHNTTNQLEVINNTNDMINSLSGFPRKFMEADPKKYFTINLALLTTDLSTGLFLNRHKIEENAFPIKFTKNGKTYVKVVYGLYPTKQKATEAINNLSNALKANKPTIEGIGRKQTLFKTNDINLSRNSYKKKK